MWNFALSKWSSTSQVNPRTWKLSMTQLSFEAIVPKDSQIHSSPWSLKILENSRNSRCWRYFSPFSEWLSQSGSNIIEESQVIKSVSKSELNLEPRNKRICTTEHSNDKYQLFRWYGQTSVRVISKLPASGGQHWHDLAACSQISLKPHSEFSSSNHQLRLVDWSLSTVPVNHGILIFQIYSEQLYHIPTRFSTKLFLREVPIQFLLNSAVQKIWSFDKVLQTSCRSAHVRLPLARSSSYPVNHYFNSGLSTTFIPQKLKVLAALTSQVNHHKSFQSAGTSPATLIQSMTVTRTLTQCFHISRKLRRHLVLAGIETHSVHIDLAHVAVSISPIIPL